MAHSRRASCAPSPTSPAPPPPASHRPRASWPPCSRSPARPLPVGIRRYERVCERRLATVLSGLLHCCRSRTTCPVRLDSGSFQQTFKDCQCYIIDMSRLRQCPRASSSARCWRPARRRSLARSADAGRSNTCSLRLLRRFRRIPLRPPPPSPGSVVSCSVGTVSYTHLTLPTICSV